MFSIKRLLDENFLINSGISKKKVEKVVEKNQNEMCQILQWEIRRILEQQSLLRNKYEYYHLVSGEVLPLTIEKPNCIIEEYGKSVKVNVRKTRLYIPLFEVRSNVKIKKSDISKKTEKQLRTLLKIESACGMLNEELTLFKQLENCKGQGKAFVMNDVQVLRYNDKENFGFICSEQIGLAKT